MAIPKAKPEAAKKKKTYWDKLKGSALFILVVIILATVGVVALVMWISQLLSGK